MTREEAINLLGWLKSKTNQEDDLEAIDMAIEALSADAVSDQYLKGFEDAKRAYDIELYHRPQEELLTHEQAWADIESRPHGDLPDIPRAYYERVVHNMSHEINMLKQQLEDGRPHGEWIVKDNEFVCSLCGNSVSFSRTDKGWILGRFCQTCGASMVDGRYNMRAEQTDIIKETAESVERLKAMGILEDRKFPFHDEIMEKLDKLTLRGDAE